MAFLIGGANSAVSVYDIDNSWRGNGSNSYFNRTLEHQHHGEFGLLVLGLKECPVQIQI